MEHILTANHYPSHPVLVDMVHRILLFHQMYNAFLVFPVLTTPMARYFLHVVRYQLLAVVGQV